MAGGLGWLGWLGWLAGLAGLAGWVKDIWFRLLLLVNPLAGVETKVLLMNMLAGLPAGKADPMSVKLWGIVQGILQEILQGILRGILRGIVLGVLQGGPCGVSSG